MTEYDSVERPAHYNQGDIEAIDAMRQIVSPEEFRAHCRLTAFKYLWRAKDKDAEDENYKKAIWYLRFAVGDEPREYKKKCDECGGEGTISAGLEDGVPCPKCSLDERPSETVRKLQTESIEDEPLCNGFPPRPDASQTPDLVGIAIRFRDLLPPGSCVYCDKMGVVPEGMMFTAVAYHDLAMSCQFIQHLGGCEYKLLQPLNVNYFLGRK